MAATGLLALLDDISAIADDVATLTMAASKKTAGIVTDDMAVTAEQAVGLQRERELPVVGKVALGSIINKLAILVPAGIALSFFAPFLLTPLLMLGGAYLCFEGVEKILHKILHPKDHAHEGHGAEDSVDPEAFERKRVWGAIRTDFILSAEIIAISLGEVAEAPVITQVSTLVVISIIMTVGVYGLVAVLVKLDDMGEAMVRAGGAAAGIGKVILLGMPWLMKAISWIGAIAMLLVGGHIILHGIPPIEAPLHEWLHGLHLHWALEELANTAFGFITGMIVGGILAGIWATGVFQKLWGLVVPKKVEA